MTETREQQRLAEAREQAVPWKRWGPYLSERQWGTVREDYSADGNAWDYFSHDQARSRAYRWGEFQTTRTGATASCSTNTSTATSARGSARAIRPAGRASSRG